MSPEHPEGELENDHFCPICDSDGTLDFAAASDRLFGIAPGSFRLRRCTACGCVFQSPVPDPQDLGAYYPREYWWAEHERSRFSKILSRLERAYREFVAQDHVRFLELCAAGPGGGRSLLDIGCGSGTFLHLAARRGFLTHGMDVSEQAVETARRQYGLPMRQGEIGGCAWKDRRFDFVTMFHVLEHLVDPAMALVHVRRLLKPGGSLILQVPNAASIQAGLFGAHWYGFDVPRHVINYTPKSLRILFERAGFRCRLESRFSLRDNPAALASSIAIGLDPIGRKGRGKKGSALVEGMLEFLYFGLTLLSLPPALIESLVGRGATLWVHAQPKS